jgi:ComF family protein
MPVVPSDWKDALLDLLYPRKCGLCGLFDERSLCEVCRSGFERLPFDDTADPWLDFRHALFVYEGRAKQAVHRLKFERITSLARPMSTELRSYIEHELAFGFDLIVPVPIHWTRRYQRGFNQSELLTRGWPEEWLAPGALVRQRATRPQSSVSPPERLSNLEGAFRVVQPEDIVGQSILLLDDVVTSGSTSRECARTLKIAGSGPVGILAFAGG